MTRALLSYAGAAPVAGARRRQVPRLRHALDARGRLLRLLYCTCNSNRHTMFCTPGPFTCFLCKNDPPVILLALLVIRHQFCRRKQCSLLCPPRISACSFGNAKLSITLWILVLAFCYNRLASDSFNSSIDPAPKRFLESCSLLAVPCPLWERFQRCHPFGVIKYPLADMVDLLAKRIPVFANVFGANI